MFSLILSLLGTVGEKLIGAHNRRVDAESQIAITRVKEQGSTERLQAELAATLKKRQAGLIKGAMSHGTFWVVWGLFAIPLGMWWALVMLDSMTPTHVLSLGIPDLPISIQPYADQIFNNIFYSGAGMGGVQILGRAFLGRRP